jgi:hypothetical protein
MNAAFGLRLDAVFFLAGAFLLAFFFAAIRVSRFRSVVGWFIVALPRLEQRGEQENAEGKRPCQ